MNAKKNTHYVAFFDIDGTLFDPDLRLLAAPYFNRKSFKLLKKNKATIVVTTGRRSWIKTNDLQLHMLGMYPPDHVVTGIGTNILHKKYHYVYGTDKKWQEEFVKKGWNKQEILRDTNAVAAKYRLFRIPTINQFTITFWLFNTPISKVKEIREDMERESNGRFRTVITEQLLLPNTKDRFSGFLFLIPQTADKGTSAVHLLDMIKKAHPNDHLHIFCFGDALVDVPLLTIDYPNATIQSFGLHLTPQAQMALSKMENIRVVSYFDSAPKRIWKVLSTHIASNTDTVPKKVAQNSPFRRLIRPFEFIIDRFAPQEFTPDDITEHGITLVNEGVHKLYDIHGGQAGRVTGYWELVRGYFMDIVDGVRARNSPHLKSDQGYLLDALADRKKEFALLYGRSSTFTYSAAAAISCVLPSIARAQAECMGIMVPEHDARGGSALSRTVRLLFIAFMDLLQLTHVANAQTQALLDANLATYAYRASLAHAFDPKKKKNYDATSYIKYESLVSLLEEQWKVLQKQRLTSQMPENLKKTIQNYISTP